MAENKNKSINEIYVVDTLNILTEKGFTNLFKPYGPIKNVQINKTEAENCVFIEFENEDSVHKIINNQLELPSFISIERSTKCQAANFNAESFENVEESEENENQDLDNKLNADQEEALINEAVYLGPDICGKDLIEESKKLKIDRNNNEFYNLENDNLFGRPLNTEWKKMEKLELGLNNLDSYHYFENSTCGKIKIEKKISPNTFIGWPSYFNDGENVFDTLKDISNDIECSNNLNIGDLKRGLLVGAFDNITKLYGRAYVILVFKDSANVALSDFGRVINTTKIKSLPDKYTHKPAYAFKFYSKSNIIPILKEELYVFKVFSISAERTILTITSDNSAEYKIQLNKWQPTVEESGVSYVDFTSGTSVELLKLKKMDTVFLRSKEKAHMEIFFSTWNSVALHCYLNPQCLERKPIYGEIIGYKSAASGNNYVRGRIHKYLGNNLYTVKQMDNPIKENIKSSEMIELLYEHKIMPVCYFKVGLNNAVPYPIMFEALSLVNLLIGFTLKVNFNESKDDGWKKVGLRTKINDENFNVMLYNLVEPSWLKNIKNELDYYETYFTHSDLILNELKINTVVNMTFVMYFEGIFYMRDNLYDKNFIWMSNMIKEYCSVNHHSYLPRIDEVCLAKFPDGMWYRVICDDIRPGGLAQVHSVDLGRVAFLGSRHLRKISIELLKCHPVHVYLCVLDTSNMDEDAKILPEKLNLLHEKENNFCVDFKVMENFNYKNSYFISCPLIQNILM